MAISKSNRTGTPSNLPSKAPAKSAPKAVAVKAATAKAATGKSVSAKAPPAKSAPASKPAPLSDTAAAAAKERRLGPLRTPTDLGAEATQDIAAALTRLLADMFALYVKTKNFHWHVSGPHFRDYHLMLDEQGAQIFATTDDLAERVRKVGGTTLRSIGHIARLQRIPDNEADYVTAPDMLAELAQDNIALTTYLREAHAVCEDHNDIASTSLIENWIDEAERRTWFLYEATRSNH